MRRSFLDELRAGRILYLLPTSRARSLATVPPSATRHDTPPNRRPWSPVCSPPVRSDSPSSGVRGSSTSLPFLVPCGQHGFRISAGTVRLIAAFLSAIVDGGIVLVPPCRRRLR